MEDRLTLAAFNAATEGRGNVKLVWGTYRGTGEYGWEHPNTLTFDGKPLYIVVRASSTSKVEDQLELYQGLGNPAGKWSSGSIIGSVTWSGNSVFWSSPSDAGYQYNHAAYTYTYLALIGV